MKKRTILIVPPRGGGVKTIEIRLSLVITVFVILGIGLIGFIIPFNNQTQNIVEQNQKKNLYEQNKALLQKILSTLKLLNHLKEQVTNLEKKQQDVLSLGVSEDFISKRQNKIDFSKLQSDALLEYVETQGALIQSFLNFVQADTMFERVPIIYPLLDSFMISRPYGKAVDPFTSKEKVHYGVDFVAKEGIAVIATAAGVVTRVENHPIWGIRVQIDHNDHYSTVYAHLGSVSVGKGKAVKRGQTIGTLGSSGLSTGPHLHYEILRNDTSIDPAEIIFPIHHTYN
ncbi:MAG: M23 family metallopeptidase [Fibrobacter sp.]|nr:M23 family metallopeptidase [Fibrobacter sp.]